MGMGLLTGMRKMLKIDRGDGCTTLNILKTTEVCTLKWRCVQYVNCISIKLLVWVCCFFFLKVCEILGF